jgi:hypothetical protein
LRVIPGTEETLSNWHDHLRDLYQAHRSKEEFAMFKIAVVVFALAVSGFMLWVAHENSNFAQLPRATFMKRAA